MKFKYLLTIIFFLPHVCIGQSAGTISDPFFDSRDSISYQTINMGGTLWMQENCMHYVVGSDCYEHDTANCIKYGRLYTYAQAKNVCPAGWRLPRAKDWQILIEQAGGDKVAGGVLKAGGISDFSIRMTGIRRKLDFIEPGMQTGFWASDTGKPGTAFSLFFYRSDSKVKMGYVSDVDYRLSVRCVKIED